MPLRNPTIKKCRRATNSNEEVFVIDGVTRRQIIEEIADHYDISLDYSDSRITREMCQELADELSVTEPEEREARYQVLLGGIANASGIAWDTRQI